MTIIGALSALSGGLRAVDGHVAGATRYSVCSAGNTHMCPGTWRSSSTTVPVRNPRAPVRHPLHSHLLAGPESSAAIVEPANPSLFARARETQSARGDVHGDATIAALMEDLKISARLLVGATVRGDRVIADPDAAQDAERKEHVNRRQRWTPQ